MDLWKAGTGEKIWEDLELEARGVVLGGTFMEACEVVCQSDALIFVWLREGFPGEHAHIAYGTESAHPRLETPGINADRFLPGNIRMPVT